MFTGIIAGTGKVERIEGGSLYIRAGIHGLKMGDSLAVNGCCLTTLTPGPLLQFDLLQETMARTNFQFLRTGDLVNLEQPLRADGRFDGHFVTGHIDGIGKVTAWEKSGADYKLDIEAPPEVMRYIVAKGSIAIDGISLTIAEVDKKGFRVWIIPHTYKVTNLPARKVGDAVNLEADMIGKYVEKFVIREAP